MSDSNKISLKQDIIWRVAVIYFCIAFFALIIIGRVIFLQFIEADKWKAQAQKLTLKNEVIEANRGDILDVHGRLLATSIPLYDIRADMANDQISRELFACKVDSLSLCLSKLFKDKTAAQYRAMLVDARRKGNRYLLLQRNATHHELQMVKSFPIFRSGRYKGGLIAEKKSRRIYPYGSMLAGRTIGYTASDEQVGKIAVGVEGSFDTYLKGTNGMRLMRRISGNTWMQVGSKDEVEPKDGMDIVTTIDINLQDVAENALLKQLQKHEAHHGCAVVMEVATGEIRAIANLERDEQGAYHESYNYAIGESTEPGSTFKLLSLMVALEDGYIHLNDTIDAGKGKVRFYNHIVEDTKEEGYGRISVKQAFEVSSNVAVSKIITRYYKGRERQFIDRIYSMKVQEPLGLEIQGEGKPHVKYPGDRYWSGISLPMISFGYEVQLTPLQILTIYNAVANNGRMMKPRFVKEIRFHGLPSVYSAPEVIVSSIASRSTIARAREMLEGVVENGTAVNLKNCNYKIAGKTGTAQVANRKYGYRNDKGISYQASFAGYFPADKPRYSCIVVINAPSKHVYYANIVAGPVFKEISDKIFATSPDLHPLITRRSGEITQSLPTILPGNRNDTDKALAFLKIPSKRNHIYSNWISAQPAKNEIEMDNLNVYNGLVPNVKGMGVKDALYILENAGLRVIISGFGVVRGQSLEPGKRIVKGEKIILNLG